MYNYGASKDSCRMEGVRLGPRSVSSGEKDALEDSSAITLGAK
jgi:hypothetical protein